MLFKRENSTLVSQLITFIFIFLVLIFLISYAVTRHFVGQVMLDHARRDIGHLALEKVQLIEKDLLRIETQGKNLRFLIMNSLLTNAELNEYIQHMFADNQQLKSVCIALDPDWNTPPVIYQASPNGMVSGTIVGSEYQYRDWFQITSLIKKGYWSEPWYDTYGTQNLIVSYSLPFIQKGSQRGVIRLDLPLENLQKVAQEVRVYKEGYAVLLTDNGTIVTNPADSLLMNYTIFDVAEELNLPDLRLLGQLMCADSTGFQKLAKNKYYPANWVYYLPLASNKWTLSIIVADKEVFADLRNLLLIYLLSSIGAFLVLITVIYVRTRAIYKNLNPLVESLKRIGAGDFDAPLPPRPKMYEVKILTSAFDMMLSALREHVHNIQTVTDEKNKILDEVLFASAIQRNLIPKNTDPAPKTDQIRAFSILEPAGAIGGDLYDYFMIGSDHFCFAVADVAGKGIVAAMTMTMVTTLLRSIAPNHTDPAQILRRINNFLVDHNLESNFVTIILGIIDLRTSELCYSNAGHVPLYIINPHQDVHKYSETHSTALGFLANIKIDSEVIKLHPGDEIILVTDGITEAMSSHEDFFGTQGLETILRNIREAHPQITAATILAAVQAFSDPAKHKDDITILTIEYLKNRDT